MAVYANYFHATKHVTISDSADGDMRYCVQDADGLLASCQEWHERFGVKSIHFDCGSTHVKTNMRWIRSKVKDIMDEAIMNWEDEDYFYDDDDYDEEAAADLHMETYIDEYEANQNFLD